jgi:PAS domain S-box-containing protein
MQNLIGRKRAEQLLAQSQQMAHIGSWELDILENNLIWSDETFRIFGLQPQEFGATYEAFMDIVHPDDRTAVDLAYSGSLLDGRDSYEIEHRVVRRHTGEIRYVFEKCIHERDDKNQAIRSIGIVQDITEKKLAEDALKESEHRYRNLVERSPNGIAIFQEDQYVYINPSGVKLFGASSADEILGKSFLSFIHPDSLQNVKQKMEMVSKGIPIPPLEEQLVKLDGSAIYASIVIIDNVFNGKPAGQTIMRDITKRKRTENTLKENDVRLRELNATKDKFFSILAHDLRSPFNNILGFSEILKNEVKDLDIDSIEQYAGIIHSSALNTFQLLNSLLDWARTQQGAIPFNPIKLLLKQIVNSEFAGLEIQSLHKQIELVEDIPDNFIITADENMLRTCLRNLISNAIKFSNKFGEVKVIANLQEGQAMISVIDQGIGMSQETIDKLFRIETSFSTRGTLKEKGTGLGLILCKEFIHKHGGEICVDSEIGKGSTFTFNLPQ